MADENEKPNEKAIYVGLIMHAHFGLQNWPNRETVCAGCGMEVPWPCSPVLLAQIVKAEIES